MPDEPLEFMYVTRDGGFGTTENPPADASPLFDKAAFWKTFKEPEPDPAAQTVFDRAALDKAFDELEENGLINQRVHATDLEERLSWTAIGKAHLKRDTIGVPLGDLPPRPETEIGGFRDRLAIWWLTQRRGAMLRGNTITINKARSLERAAIAALRTGMLGNIYGVDFYVSSLSFSEVKSRPGWVVRKWQRLVDQFRWLVIWPVTEWVESRIERPLDRSAWRRLHRHGELAITSKDGKSTWLRSH